MRDSAAQQQLPACGVCFSPPSHRGALLILALGARASFDSPRIPPPPSLATRLWISEAMVRKARSTLSELLALVSRKGTLRAEASADGRGPQRAPEGGRYASATFTKETKVPQQLWRSFGFLIPPKGAWP
ncbi:hypothetical protein EYF80_021030 [Liparis tanakae]|uniref:Uncharacterized protein n=1 Tax=Liparis tanakae TaxID=230148 RepID=A0A4Z2HSI1_9TELE|nr:hypothetical protein EYF80_021030 [Liparis tanakae]